MSKLLVLSEIDCKGYLNSIGVHPDEFYTDFEFFKNKSSTFFDVDILIIFAGCCQFSRRNVVDMINNLQKRVDNADDKGIISVTVLSDCTIPTLDNYYLFKGTFKSFSQYRRKKMVTSKVDILSKINRGTEDTECRCFYKDIDLKVSETIDTSEDDLLKFIQKPDFGTC